MTPDRAAVQKAESEVDSRLMISIVDAGCVVSFERIYAYIEELERKRRELAESRYSPQKFNMTQAQLDAEIDRRQQEFQLIQAAARPVRLMRSSLLAISQKGYDITSFGPLISLTSGLIMGQIMFGGGGGGSTSTSIEGFLCTVKKK